MAQFLRPNSDIFVNPGWNAAPFYSKIDEVVPNDFGDFINVSSATPTSITIGLSSGSTPVAGTRTLRVRVIYELVEPTSTLTITLQEGSTEIRTETIRPPLSSTWHTFQFAITETITDYTNLNFVLATNKGSYVITWVEFEIPDEAPLLAPKRVFMIS